MRYLVYGFIYLFAANLPASDWPEFRGPNRDGNSPAKGVPIEWSPDKNIAWKQAIPGNGWSSPVLLKGRIYLTSAVPGGAGDHSLRALCLDAVSGKIIWNAEVFPQDPAKPTVAHKKNSHASPTPIVNGDRLYVHFGPQGTACLNLDGKVLWQNRELSYPPVHGNGGSPVLVGNALTFSCDAVKDPFVVALDKQSGKVLWRVARESSAKKKFSFSTPQVIDVKGQKQIISPGSGVVCALNPQDGSEIWRVRYGEGYSVIPQPAFANGLLFLSSGFDRPNALAIRPDGKGDVTDTHVTWTLSRGAPLTPSMLAVGNELYLSADNGIASCVDAKSGEVLWSERVEGNYSASPLHAEGRVYFQSEQGVTTVVKAGRTFEKLAQNTLGERTLATPAIADGALYIRTETQLYRVGTSSRTARR